MVSDVGAQLVGRLLNLALGVFVTVLVVRALGDAGFGEWSSLLAVVALTGALCDLGFSQVTVRHAAADPDREPEWIGALIQLKAPLSIVAFLVGVGVIAAISSGSRMLVAGIVLATTVLLAAPNALQTVFRLRVRNDLAIVAMTAQSIVWAIVVVVVFEKGYGIVPLAGGFLAAALVNAAVIAVLALRHGRVRFRNARERWPDITRVGVPIAFSTVLILGYGKIDQILVLVLAGPEDAGLYSAVYRIFDQSQFIAISVSTTTFALLAGAFASDVVRFRQLLQATTEVMIALALPGLVLGLTYAEPLVVLLFGDEFRPAAQALPVLMATLILVSLGYVFGGLVIVTERQRPYVLVTCVGLVFNVALNVALIPPFGFMAAAWITLATEVVVLGLVWLTVRARLPAGLGLGRFPRIAAATLVTLGALAALRLVDVPVAGGIGALVLVYPLALLAARAVTTAELRALRRTVG